IKNGYLEPFNTPDLQLISEKNPYAATVIDENQIAIATSIGGCFIINRKGELIQRISKQDGLQTNNILSVFIDRNKNLWLGLDNGIDFVAYNHPIKHIYADYQEHSSGTAAIVYNNSLYIGTSNGLYKAGLNQQENISYARNDFKLITGTSGQVWNLSELNGNLLMGHNDGFYHIKNNTAQVIDGTTGFWMFLPLSNVVPSPKILAGTYNGVNFYNYNTASFTNPSIHSHFESVRYMAMDNNIAWACHAYKGLYKVELNGGINPTYTLYKDKKGILSINNNHLYKLKSRIVLTNEKGIFEYNSKTDDFEPSDYFKNVLPTATVDYLIEDAKGNIWFVNNKRLGVVEFSDSKSQTTYFPELNDKLMGNGFEFVYPYNTSNVFIAGEEGFFHLDFDEYKKRNEQIPILISGVRIINKKDSTLFGGYFSTDQEQMKKSNGNIPQISYAWNSLHFDFSSALYGKQSNIEYSYYLEDFDKSWSSWSKKTEKEYTYLSPGTYTFKVKARTHEGVESEVASYRFTILPPWYRTGWAYSVYLLFLAVLIYGGYRWQKKKFVTQQLKHEEERKRLEYLNKLQAEKHEEEQKQLMYLHQLELERNEKEIIRLRNEKLESEIQLKNTELASTTLNLIQKGEMLVKVKEEFVRMKKVKDVDTESEDYKKIIRMLGEDKMKKNWEQFAVHFDKVHSDFLVTLKTQFPNLTPSELKLCAYLRLNLSSKEIAQIMNISIKSVELARYRLRKKLGIQPDVNLFSFLLNFHSEIQ
ncbi:MAG TPA: triple tyrosine motif-containing protein, partial [Flavobacterium sp.]